MDFYIAFIYIQNISNLQWRTYIMEPSRHHVKMVSTYLTNSYSRDDH